MDDLKAEFEDMFGDFSPREILNALSAAMRDNAENEENPNAWVSAADSLDELAESQTIEDTIAW